MSVPQAIAQGFGEAAKAGVDAYGAYEQGKASKREAKEKKRKTLAELLNAVMNREFEAGEGIRQRGADLSKARANALQNMASQYVQALR